MSALGKDPENLTVASIGALDTVFLPEFFHIVDQKAYHLNSASQDFPLLQNLGLEL